MDVLAELKAEAERLEAQLRKLKALSRKLRAQILFLKLSKRLRSAYSRAEHGLYWLLFREKLGR